MHSCRQLLARFIDSCLPNVRGVRTLCAPILLIYLCIGATGCSDLLGSNEFPSGTRDPESFNTPEGARAAYRGTLSQFQREFAQFVINSGILTDELQDRNYGAPSSTSAQTYSFDGRVLPESQTYDTRDYSTLQRIRAHAIQSIGALAKYDPESSPVLRGEMYAIMAYAELLLADLYCSGIPLSTLDFEKDFTYRPGSKTSQVYEHALALMDTALTLSADSVRVANLVRIGRGRLLLALGKFAEAEQAVQGVPVDYVYQFPVEWSTPTGNTGTAFFGSVSSIEGINGLDFRTLDDPRVGGIKYTENAYHFPVYFPRKFGGIPTTTTVTAPLSVADGIEAALIRAEAALVRKDPSWVPQLNALRTDGTFTTAPNPETPDKIDTTWNAGTGGKAGLKPLRDPVDSSKQVSMMFSERAAWLFLTGHRQGDLRRLIRQYRRSQAAVYPTGRFSGSTGVYGNDVTLPIPQEERTNPFFKGCFDRNA